MGIIHKTSVEQTRLSSRSKHKLAQKHALRCNEMHDELNCSNMSDWMESVCEAIKKKKKIRIIHYLIFCEIRQL